MITNVLWSYPMKPLTKEQQRNIAEYLGVEGGVNMEVRKIKLGGQKAQTEVEYVKDGEIRNISVNHVYQEAGNKAGKILLKAMGHDDFEEN